MVNVLSLFFTGELVNKISELVAKLDWEKVKEAISEIPGAIWEDFTGKWNSPNKTDAAEFRGKVIGYIIAEIALAILSGGVLTEIKWLAIALSKLGAAGELLLELIVNARKIMGKEVMAEKYAKELQKLRRTVDFDKELISKTISKNLRIQKQQDKHTFGGKDLQANSYFKSVSDAQKILDATHAGEAKILSINTTQNRVYVELNSVTRYYNHSNNIVTTTHKFMIKGEKSATVVPIHNNALNYK